MKNKHIGKFSALLIIILLSIWIINISAMYFYQNSRGTPKEEMHQKEEIDYGTNFALMIEQEDGTYKERASNKWPENYKLNIDKSKCIDKDGNELNNALSVTKEIIEVRTTTSTYCYLYFDLPPLTSADYLISNVSNDVLWKSTLEDDGYRYIGTDPDNYVCFGTTDQEKCKNNTDKYMYRIIGIFEGIDGEQHLKLIKKEALNSTYQWHSDITTDTDWDGSDLYNGINGNYFLTNTTYNYMQNTTWTNKIEIWNYTAANTKSYENYITHGVYGLNYWYNPSKIVYLHEMNQNSKTNQTCYFFVDYFMSKVITADCDVGEWKTVSSKMGLMYVSDYFLSLGSTSLEYTSDEYEILKSGWLHISNNDIGAPSQDEWTMTRFGDAAGYYGAWYVDSGDFVGGEMPVEFDHSIRPVFYLKSDVTISGEGTTTNPYIITN